MYNSGNSSKNVTGASVVDGTMESADFADNGLSGDKIDGGIISNFQSTGIDDRLPTGKVLTLSTTGADIDGSVTCDGFTSTGIDDNATSTAITIDASEDVTVNTGNLVIGTSGKGIDFSATPNITGTSSELLDDYEEGTFIPTISSGTFTYANCHYTKVGNMVTITMYANGISGGSGTLQFGSMPFSSNTSYFGAVKMYAVSMSADNYAVRISGTNVTIDTSKSGVAWGAVNHSEVTPGDHINFSITYRV
jgi:hypothetical protein